MFNLKIFLPVLAVVSVVVIIMFMNNKSSSQTQIFDNPKVEELARAVNDADKEKIAQMIQEGVLLNDVANVNGIMVQHFALKHKDTTILRFQTDLL